MPVDLASRIKMLERQIQALREENSELREISRRFLAEVNYHKQISHNGHHHKKMDDRPHYARSFIGSD
ncbi:MAG: hypothetical protein WCT19_03100 [Candidatus Paceibacterota bacterium]